MAQGNSQDRITVKSSVDSMSFTLEEIAKELAQSAGDGFFSVKEMQKAGNCSRDTVYKMIHKFDDLGRLEVMRRQGENITGKAILVPVYRIKGESDE